MRVYIFATFFMAYACEAVDLLAQGAAAAKGNWSLINPNFSVLNHTFVETVNITAITNASLSKRDYVSYTVNGYSSLRINFEAVTEVDFSLYSVSTNSLNYYFMDTSDVAACVQQGSFSCLYYTSCSCLNAYSCDKKCQNLKTTKYYTLIIQNLNSNTMSVSGDLKSYACQAGYFMSTGSCTACPGGTYSSQSSSSSCSTCAAGTFATGGATSCSSCAAGTYSAAGASSCSSCPVGYTSNSGASACLPSLVAVKNSAVKHSISSIGLANIPFMVWLFS